MQLKSGLSFLLFGVLLASANANAEVVNHFVSVITNAHGKHVISGSESFTPLKHDADYRIVLTDSAGGHTRYVCQGLVNTQVPLLCSAGTITPFVNSAHLKNVSTFTSGYNIAMVSGTQNGVSMINLNAIDNTLLGFKVEGTGKNTVQLPRFSSASINFTVHIDQGKTYTTKVGNYTITIRHIKTQ